jgi:hypothetical protein
LKEALKRNAADLETRVYMAATLAAAGNLVGARWEVEEIRVLHPDFSLNQWLRTSPISDSRQKEQLTGLLGKAGL